MSALASCLAGEPMALRCSRRRRRNSMVPLGAVSCAMRTASVDELASTVIEVSSLLPRMTGLSMKFPWSIGILPRIGTGALLVLSLVALPRPAPAAVPAEATLAMLTTAREAAQQRRWEQVAAAVPALQSDLLAVYPEYWLLQPRLSSPGMPLPVS